MRLREASPAVLATTAAIALTGCGSNGNHIPTDPTTSAEAQIENTVQADCNQAPIPFTEYSTLLGGQGTNIMQPLAFSTGPNGYQFKSSEASQTASEVAKNISQNTAALAIVWTIINQANTNISVLDEAKAVNGTLTELANNPKDRSTVCDRVVRGILKAPEQLWYQSITGKITTYEPAYSQNSQGQETLSGIDSQTNADQGPIDVFNIAPIAGTANEALQQAIANAWGITPNGSIIETEYKIGNLKISNSGTPTKVKMHGHIPETSKQEKYSVSTSGKGSSKSTVVSVSGTTHGTGNGGGVQVGHQGCGHTTNEKCGGGSGSQTGNEGLTGTGKGGTKGGGKSGGISGSGSGGGETTVSTTTPGTTTTVSTTTPGTTSTETTTTPTTTETTTTPTTTTTETTTTPTTTTTTGEKTGTTCTPGPFSPSGC